jgi:hypothetical protein
MRRIVKLPVVLGLATACALAAPIAEAQTTATAVLKSGQRHTGTNLAYRIDNRQVVVRTSQAEEPRIPVDQVAYIDFGGTPDPPNLNLSGSQEAVVLRDGTAVRGQIVEVGHTNKADLNSPFMVIIKSENGEERRFDSKQVARAYFAGGQPAASGTTGSAVTPPPDQSGTGLVVPSQQPWTPTGLSVRRGEMFSIRATGEISFGPGKASPVGSSETHPNNPLPNVATGALIGKIGNGAPFVIGNQTQLIAPAAGQLFLGINDSFHGDNEGSYRVEIQRQAGRSRH